MLNSLLFTVSSFMKSTLRTADFALRVAYNPSASFLYLSNVNYSVELIKKFLL